MRILRYKRIYLFLLLPSCLLLTHIASRHPAAVESVYATGIYPRLTAVFGRLFGLVPFSVAQWVVIVLPIALVAYIIRQIRLAAKDKERRRDTVARLTATLLALTGLVYGIFVLTCGLNYHRQSFSSASGLDVRPSATEELKVLCAELVERANALRSQVAQDEDGVMSSSRESDYQVADIVRDAYALVGEDYPKLSGYTVPPKPVTLSRAMSYLDITGVYTPYTFEANVNVDVPDVWIPSTMAHELAHSKGYMREDEANFIAYLVCSASGDPDLDYSGTVLALIHSTNALYAGDRDSYWEVMNNLDPAIWRDLDANAAYWKQFEGPVAEVSSAVNDVYLKSNRQTEGVKSYGAMVDLLLAEYRQRHNLA